MRYAFVDSLGSSVSLFWLFLHYLQICLKAESYQLLTHQVLGSGHAIDHIILAPTVEKALVLCGKF